MGVSMWLSSSGMGVGEKVKKPKEDHPVAGCLARVCARGWVHAAIPITQKSGCVSNGNGEGSAYAKKASPTRYNGTISVLRHVLAVAVEAGVVYSNAAAAVTQKSGCTEWSK
jgi:hypothetical protein